MENHKTIAQIYKVIGKIGSGGGGIIYLAEHLRLGKKVVLKQYTNTDKLKLSSLRREVDALKNLSHSYIPQVYDFVIEDEMFYAVMDYIDGQSFDQLLSQQRTFLQRDIMKWSIQLLEALVYLHSLPPYGILHSDIKPANIMLTSQGDIRLIDFNIALALRADGAVSVGRSRGYASPEHYGIDMRESPKTEGIHVDLDTDMSSAGTDIDKYSYLGTDLEPSYRENSSSSGDTKNIMIDARSDIYSLGASLYHMITGIKPAEKVDEIIPIVTNKFSLAFVNIVKKAMNANPDRRYQSAEEMLYAIKNIRNNDIRVKRYKRRRNIVASIIALLFMVGISTSFVGLKQMERLSNYRVLAQNSKNALREGNVNSAIDFAMKALPEDKDLFDTQPIPQVQEALTSALGVYDLSDGFKDFKTLVLDSEMLDVQLSPNAKTAVALCIDKVIIFDTESTQILDSLKTNGSALTQVQYINDSHIIFGGEDGLTLYDIEHQQIIFTGDDATNIAVSTDLKTVATIYRDEDVARIYDLETGQQINTISFNGKVQQVVPNDVFANPHDNLLALNDDGTQMAVSFSDGSLSIYNLIDNTISYELLDDTSEYSHFEGGFHHKYFAFSASSFLNGKNGTSVFVILDVEKGVQTVGFESDSYFGVKVDDTGIYVQNQNLLVSIDPYDGSQMPLVNMTDNIVTFARDVHHRMISTDNEYLFFDDNALLIETRKKEDGGHHIAIEQDIALIASLDSPKIRILHYEHHKDTQLMHYDSGYEHDEARISADEKTAMLYSYDKFRVYDIQTEKVIANQDIPNADEVYDQQFIKKGNTSYLEVVYNDGTVHEYSSKDGSLIKTYQKDKPSKSLEEVFTIDGFIIKSPLHGQPTVYDNDTMMEVTTLKADDYLTYVTQMDEYLITEYVTSEGFRYGLLLDKNFEQLARLDYLSDVSTKWVVLDYPTGDLRKTKIYELDKLVQMAKQRREHE